MRLEVDLSGLLQNLVDITELIVRVKKGNLASVGVHGDNFGWTKHTFYIC